METRSKGIGLGRDLEMGSRQLREKDLRVAIAVESGGIDLDVSVSVEGGEEGSDVVDTTDADERGVSAGVLEAVTHCSEYDSGDVGGCFVRHFLLCWFVVVLIVESQLVREKKMVEKISGAISNNNNDKQKTS